MWPARGSRPAALLAALAAALAVGCGSDDEAPSAPRATPFDAGRAFADLEAQVEIGPRPSGSPAARRTANLIAGRLTEAGVLEVATQRPWRNVVGRIEGTESGAVVVGAHYDTEDEPGFVGANDGASGVAVVLEIARSLPLRVEGPSIHLALFDAEEARGERPFEVDGTRGSRQYVEYARRGGEQGSPPLGEIEAMVLFDMVGDCDLSVPRETYSDPALYERFAAAAREADGSAAPFEGATGPILDDHIPFREAGVPALDLIDFDYGPGPSPGAWWHTREDTVEHVCPESLDAVGEAALRALPALGG